MAEYEFKIDEREGKFWAVVCTTKPIQPGVRLRRTTSQEEGPYKTREAAATAGEKLRERFKKLKSFW
jgi:hypothetical protein